MSIATLINGIQTNRNTIRTKLVELGLVGSTAQLDALAAAIEDIANQGAVSATVREGDTYTIPAGYHNGSGTVSGVAGGGNYTLQSKTVTPTKKTQSVTPDSGYYGLSDVTVSMIPDNYQDVSSVTTTEADVLSGKIFVTSDGVVHTGTMPNNGAISKTIDAVTVSYTIPKGYHSGTGTVKLTVETKTVTPTKATQKVTPSNGKVLSEVTVNPIPDNYQDISGVTATPENVLTGKVYVNANGEEVRGTMPDNVAYSTFLTVDEFEHIIPEGYHDGMGTVSIEIEEKTTTPTKTTQTITPSNGKVIGKVVVNAIPGNYITTSDATAGAADILSGKTGYVDGKKVTGTMPNNGAVSKRLDVTADNQSYTVPKGYHDGTGTVTIDTEEKTATPTKNTQTITPSTGTVISKVTIDPIPDEYQDVSGVTATAGKVLEGSVFVDAEGNEVEGTMPNNGQIAVTIDGLVMTSYPIPAGYHNGLGTVSLTDDIEEALASI